MGEGALEISPPRASSGGLQVGDRSTPGRARGLQNPLTTENRAQSYTLCLYRLYESYEI